MFNKRTTPSLIDLLFNLVLTFAVLFALAFIQINTTTSEKSVDNSNNILISMKWNVDCDVDLWLLLPDGRKVFYGNREEPPAHLDVDVTRWRRYNTPDGETQVIKENEEIISIRSVLGGEYAINAHLFNSDHEGEIEVEILVENVKARVVLYSGKKSLNNQEVQKHFVRFTVVPQDQDGYTIEEVHVDRPIFFVGGDPEEGL